MNKSTVPLLYCYPVEPKRDQYVGASLYEIGGIIPQLSEMARYLSSSFEKKMALVEIEGVRAQSFVYVPKGKTDFCYVIVNGDHKCVETLEDDSSQRLTDLDTNFVKALINDRLSHSEAVEPKHELHLWSQFMTPNLMRIPVDQLEENSLDIVPPDKLSFVSWERMLDTSRVVILGNPGSGKTTLCRRIALECADDYLNSVSTDKLFPLYLELRNWDFSSDITQNIQKQLSISEGADTVISNFDSLARAGRILLCFDGLDEVIDEKRSRVKSAIGELARKYPTVRIIITCRPSVFGHPLEDFVYFQITPFSPSQVQELARISIEDGARFSWFMSRLTEEKELYELVQNPLLLSIMVSLYDQHEGNPHFITSAIDKFAWMLLRDWDSHRGIKRTNSKAYSPSRKMALLQRLSVHMLAQGKLEITSDDLIYSNSRFAGASPDEGDLQAIENHTGLLLQVAQNRWRFAHRAFADYFASLYLVDATKDIFEILEDIIRESSETSLTRHVCGLSSDASNVLMFIRQQKEAVPTLHRHLTEALIETANVEKETLKSTIEVYIDMLRAQFDNINLQLSNPDIDTVPNALKHSLDSDFYWYVIFVCEATRIDEMRTLVHSVYRMRDSLSSQLLEYALCNSLDERLISLAGCLKKDGDWTEKDIGDNQLLFGVAQSQK